MRESGPLRFRHLLIIVVVSVPAPVLGLVTVRRWLLVLAAVLGAVLALDRWAERAAAEEPAPGGFDLDDPTTWCGYRLLQAERGPQQ